MTTAVLFLEDDVQMFAADRPAGVGRVLALTPVARAALREAGIGEGVSGTLENYGKTAQRRVLARLRRADRCLIGAMADEEGLSTAAKYELSDYVWRIGALGLRSFETLGREGPWLIAGESGWQQTGDRIEAAGLLLRKILSYQAKPCLKTPSTVPGPLIELAWRVALWRMRARRCMVFGALSRGFAPLASKVHERDGALSVFSFKVAREINFKSLISLVVNAGTLRHPVTLPMPAKEAPLVFDAVSGLLAGISDPLVRFFAEANRGLIASGVQDAEGWSLRFDSLMGSVRPKGVVVYDTSNFKNVSLADAARRANVPVLAVSHAPNFPADTGTDAYLRARIERRMLGHGLADTTVVQTPLSEKMAEWLCPDTRRRRSRPVAWGHNFRQADPAKPGAKTKCILYAGNYIEWLAHVPWVFETSDELVASLSDLVTAVSGLSNVRMIIRAKANWPRKRECSMDTLKALLPSHPNAEIKNDGPFEDDLEEAALVVSFSSSTIFDALLARRPVLLWGYEGRYRPVPARSTPPSADDRAAVYAPRDAADLAAMIPAILEAHDGRPLSDQETAPYLWPAGVPGMDDLAESLAANAII